MGGKRLLAHIMESAVKSGVVRVVSTNDDAIAGMAAAYGAEVPFRRPPRLATAAASFLSAIRHALDWFARNAGWPPELVAFPTNPFTSAQRLFAVGSIVRQWETLYGRVLDGRH